MASAFYSFIHVLPSGTPGSVTLGVASQSGSYQIIEKDTLFPIDGFTFPGDFVDVDDGSVLGPQQRTLSGATQHGDPVIQVGSSYYVFTNTPNFNNVPFT